MAIKICGNTVIPNSVGDTSLQNTAIGINSLSNNTTGHSNVAIGYGSLHCNTLGVENIAIGTCALPCLVDNTQNLAIGTKALLHFTSGACNIAIGHVAAWNINCGTSNIAVGTAAMAGAQGGTNNIGIGTGTAGWLGGCDNIGLGTGAASTGGGCNNIGIGKLGGIRLNGCNNIALGTCMGLIENGCYNVLLGNETGGCLYGAVNNIAIGCRATNNLQFSCNNIALGGSALIGGATGAGTILQCSCFTPGCGFVPGYYPALPLTLTGGTQTSPSIPTANVCVDCNCCVAWMAFNTNPGNVSYGSLYSLTPGAIPGIDYCVPAVTPICCYTTCSTWYGGQGNYCYYGLNYSCYGDGINNYGDWVKHQYTFYGTSSSTTNLNVYGDNGNRDAVAMHCLPPGYSYCLNGCLYSHVAMHTNGTLFFMNYGDRTAIYGNCLPQNADNVYPGYPGYGLDRIFWGNIYGPSGPSCAYKMYAYESTDHLANKVYRLGYFGTSFGYGDSGCNLLYEVNFICNNPCEINFAIGLNVYGDWSPAGIYGRNSYCYVVPCSYSLFDVNPGCSKVDYNFTPGTPGCHCIVPTVLPTMPVNYEYNGNLRNTPALTVGFSGSTSLGYKVGSYTNVPFISMCGTPPVNSPVLANICITTQDGSGTATLTSNYKGLDNTSVLTLDPINGYPCVGCGCTLLDNKIIMGMQCTIFAPLNDNIAIGNCTLSNNVAGTNNIAIGSCAGCNITVGENNTIIGNSAGTTSLSNTVVLSAGTCERLKIDSTGVKFSGTTCLNLPTEHSTTTSDLILGSIGFDGATDAYATAPYNSHLDFGTADFTIEFSLKFDSMITKGQTIGIIGHKYTDFSNGWQIVQFSTGDTTIYLRMADGAGKPDIGIGVPWVNVWQHWAVVRQGDWVYTYVDGQMTNAISGYTGININEIAYPATVFGLGYAQTWGGHGSGKIRNIRILNGTSLYKDGLTFTPPVGNLPNITNTVLLMNSLSANNYLVDETGNSTITAFNPLHVAYSTDYAGTSITSITYSGGEIHTGNLTLGYPAIPAVTAGSLGGGSFRTAGALLQADNVPSLNFGTNDFTIEFWMYLPNAWSTFGGGGIIGQKNSDGTNGWQIYQNGGQPSLMAARITSNNDFFSNSTPATGVWEHWAFTRTGTLYSWWKNGNWDGDNGQWSGGGPWNVSDINPLQIGYASSWGTFGDAILKDIRVINGIALYRTAFTPPTTNLPDVVNSYSFAGADYLSLPSNSTADTDLGTGDFTIDYWMNANDVGTNTSIIGTQSIAGTSTPGMWRASNRLANAAGIIFNYTSAGTWNDLSFDWGFGAVNKNDQTWHHIAFVRKNGILRAFVDGAILPTTYTVTDSLSSGQVAWIGNNVLDSSSYYVGSLRNVRVVKGIALYEGDFRPDVNPPTSTSLVTVGSAVFSGSDYLIINDNAHLNPGVDDFKITFDINPTDLSGYKRVFSKGAYATTGNFQVEVHPTAILVHVDGGYQSYPTTIPTNAWTSVVIERILGKVNVYVNAVDTGWSYFQNGNINNTSQFIVGANAAGTDGFVGNISNLTLTVGGVQQLLLYFSSTSGLLTDSSHNAFAITNQGGVTQSSDSLVGKIGTVLLTAADGTIKDHSANNYTLTNNGAVAAHTDHASLLMHVNDSATAFIDFGCNSLTLTNTSGGVVYDTRSPYPGTYHVVSPAIPALGGNLSANNIGATGINTYNLNAYGSLQGNTICATTCVSTPCVNTNHIAASCIESSCIMLGGSPVTTGGPKLDVFCSFGVRGGDGFGCSGSFGSYNIGIGKNSVALGGGWGYGEIGIGLQAIGICGGKIQNIAIGNQAGAYLGYGSCCNILLGQFAGYCMGRNGCTASQNIAIGAEAMRCSGSCCVYGNIAIGPLSLGTAICAMGNIAIGKCALYCLGWGSGNTVVGYGAAPKATCLNNTVIGYSAAQSLSTGTNNILMGPFAGNCITVGCNNTIIGTLYATTNLCNTVLIGSASCERLKVDSTGLYVNGTKLTTGLNACCSYYVGSSNTATGISNIGIGYGSLAVNTTGCDNVGIGTFALAHNTTGTENIGIGTSALQWNGRGNNNIAIGYYSLNLGQEVWNNVAVGVSALCASCGWSNTAVGAFTLCANTAGYCNVAVGMRASSCNTTGIFNTAVGTQAMQYGTGGSWNVAIGSCSLNNGISGVKNVAVGNLSLGTCSYSGALTTAIGYGAMRFAIAGCENVALGAYGLNCNISGYNNTAVGSRAMYSNTTGYFNTALGSCTLKNNTIGFCNVAVGIGAMLCNISGYGNIAVGGCAMGCNTYGWSNVAIGDHAGYSNITGYLNTAIGTYALRCNLVNNNVAVGACALAGNTTGYGNTAVGYSTLVANTVGSMNTAMGQFALASITTGIQNTAIGSGSFCSSTVGSNSVAIGYLALRSSRCGCNTAIGSQALCNNTCGSYNVGIGPYVLQNGLTGSANIAIGYAAAQLTCSNDNIAIGHMVLNSNLIGCQNVAIGSGALQYNTCSNNTAVGYNALYINSTGISNVSVGSCTLYWNSTGYNNTAVGASAMTSNCSGYGNTAMGNSTLINNRTGIYNTALGAIALSTNQTGSCNVAVGYGALRQITASCNVGIGTYAGYNITTGTNNTIIGSYFGTAGLVCTFVGAAGTCQRIYIDNNGACINGCTSPVPTLNQVLTYSLAF